MEPTDNIITLPTAEDFKKLNNLQDESHSIINDIEEEFNEIYPVIDPKDHKMINKQKNIKFKISITKTLNLLVQCVGKQNTYITGLLTPDETEKYITGLIKPIESKIANFEKTMKSNTDHNKNLEDTVVEIRNEYEEMVDKLQILQTTVEADTKVTKELHEKFEKIVNTTAPQISALRASTPFNEISLIQSNRNLKIPTFSNEPYDKPLKYLNELKEYLNANNNSDFRCTINNSLKKTASDWWHVVQEETTNYEEFVKKFTDTFWSLAIQDEHNKKLEFGRFRPDGKQTCVQYATHMAAIARDLKYSEKDLVNKISRHFTKEVKSLIRSSANKTFVSLIEILQELDTENRNRPRTQNNENKPQTPNNKDNNYRPNRGDNGAYHQKNQNTKNDRNFKKQEFKKSNPNVNNITIVADVHEDAEKIEELDSEN